MDNGFTFTTNQPILLYFVKQSILFIIYTALAIGTGWALCCNYMLTTTPQIEKHHQPVVDTIGKKGG